MINVEKNKNLKEYNTFGIDVNTKLYINIENTIDILESIKFIKNENITNIFVLGGGSNILFMGTFNGLILHINTRGITIISENDKEVYIKAEAGEKWNNLIQFCIEHNFWGLENLSMIPGKVGSSPVQNIGAYGTEVKDVIYELDAYDIFSGEKKIFKNKDCDFGYRRSIFKDKLRNKFIISSVTYKLSKIPKPNISYKGLGEELQKSGGDIYNINDIFKSVCKIRNTKLPNPDIIGNAGSFFKNPLVSSSKLADILREFPDVVYFIQDDGKVKLAAAWLIEKCGWKGKSWGNAAIYEKQPLVLINKGGASSQEIMNLANKIIEDVYSKFDVELEIEVNIVAS